MIFEGLEMMNQDYLNQIDMDKISNTHLDSQAYHQLSKDWQ